MFSSNTAEILNISSETKTQTHILKKILNVHAKLKKIAKYEHSYRENKKYEPAKLSTNESSQIKELETKLNFLLVAYRPQNEETSDKYNILNKINLLLDEYLDICKFSNMNKNEDEFSKFFE